MRNTTKISGAYIDVNIHIQTNNIAGKSRILLGSHLPKDTSALSAFPVLSALPALLGLSELSDCAKSSGSSSMQGDKRSDDFLLI